MWRIFNKLFGWDYIVWQNTCDGGIERIRLAGDGSGYFWKYGKYVRQLANPQDVTITCWLTCPPEKYLNQSKGQS